MEFILYSIQSEPSRCWNKLNVIYIEILINFPVVGGPDCKICWATSWFSHWIYFFSCIQKDVINSHRIINAIQKLEQIFTRLSVVKTAYNWRFDFRFSPAAWSLAFCFNKSGTAVGMVLKIGSRWHVIRLRAHYSGHRHPSWRSLKTSCYPFQNIYTPALFHSMLLFLGGYK